MKKIREWFVFVFLKKGKDCIEEIHRSMDGMEELVYRGMSHEERLLFRRLLLEARNNLMI